MPDRDVRNIWHQTQPTVQALEKEPLPDDLDEGVPRIYYIAGYGLYSVIKYKGKLYYNQYSASK